MTKARVLVAIALIVASLGASRLAASDPGTGDWPMWGGTPDRNMVSNAKGLATDWDVKTKKNIKWVADLGSQSYGNPVVAGGMVFVGTNNEKLRDPKQPGDRGVLMAFRETDGEFLWQQTHVKLESGRANDWPYQGIASSPMVEGNKLYYVSNRAVIFCLDIEGFRDKENDGPVTDEKLSTQADEFAGMLNSCQAVRRCVSFTVWGFDDKHSWVPTVFAGEGAATPFDESYQPKPAYFALRDALARHRRW